MRSAAVVAVFVVALGACGPKLVEGTICTNDDACASGLCSSTSHKCAPNECPDGSCPAGKGCAHEDCGTRCVAPVDGRTRCETNATASDECETLLPCVNGKACVVESTDTEETYGVCVAPHSSTLGGPCDVDDQCAPTLFCTGTGGLCWGCLDDSDCAAGSSCEVADDYREVRGCVENANVGESCSRDSLDPKTREGLPRSCAPGLDCAADVCVVPGSIAFGLSCSHDDDCVDGFCDDFVCGRCLVDADCDAGLTCGRVNEAGAISSSCVAPGNAGDVCDGGCESEGVCARECGDTLQCNVACGPATCCG